MYTSRIREQLQAQMDKQATFATRKANISKDMNLTPQGKKEPLARIEAERKQQAQTAWAEMLDTLQKMRDAEERTIPEAVAPHLAATCQIIASIDPQAPGVDAALDSVLNAFSGRLACQRVLSAALRKAGHTGYAIGLDNRIYDPMEHYAQIAGYLQKPILDGCLSGLNEAFAYLDAIDRNAPAAQEAPALVPATPTAHVF